MRFEKQITKEFIAVLGSGTMGSGIVQSLISYDYNVIFYGRSQENLIRSIKVIESNFDRRIAKGLLSEIEKNKLLKRINPTNNLSNIKKSQIVIESIIEDEHAKLEILRYIEEIIDNNAIITTNTSSISIDKLSSALKIPSRFLGLHFFNPVPSMNLVEIVRGHYTNQTTIDECTLFIKSIGKLKVESKSTPGFIVNRLARPFYLESFRLIDEGINIPDKIDTALKHCGKFKMGTFELTDLIGQDVNYKVTSQIWKDTGYDPRYTPSFFQKSLIDSGLLGRKSGQGIYSYNDQTRDTKEIKDIPLTYEKSNTIDHLCIYGTSLFSSALSNRIKGNIKINFQDEHQYLGKCIIINDELVISLTTGKRAEEIASYVGIDTILFDLALDYNNLDYLLISANQSISKKNLSNGYWLLAQVAKYIDLIQDTPGLVVARIVTCLINEAVFLTNQKICTIEDAELAAKLGVNYPLGSIEWMELVGEEWVSEMLSNLSLSLNNTRYFAHYSIKRKRTQNHLSFL